MHGRSEVGTELHVDTDGADRWAYASRGVEDGVGHHRHRISVNRRVDVRGAQKGEVRCRIIGWPCRSVGGSASRIGASGMML